MGLMLGWRWHVVPLGFPEITIPQAVALRLLLEAFRLKPVKRPKAETAGLIVRTFLPLFILLFLWLLSLASTWTSS